MARKHPVYVSPGIQIISFMCYLESFCINLAQHLFWVLRLKRSNLEMLLVNTRKNVLVPMQNITLLLTVFESRDYNLQNINHFEMSFS